MGTVLSAHGARPVPVWGRLIVTCHHCLYYMLYIYHVWIHNFRSQLYRLLLLLDRSDYWLYYWLYYIVHWILRVFLTLYLITSTRSICQLWWAIWLFSNLKIKLLVSHFYSYFDGSCSAQNVIPLGLRGQPDILTPGVWCRMRCVMTGHSARYTWDYRNVWSEKKQWKVPNGTGIKHHTLKFNINSYF